MFAKVWMFPAQRWKKRYLGDNCLDASAWTAW